MPLKVVSFATYLTNVDVTWRDADYNALKFVKAIKGLPVNGFARIPVCDVLRRLEHGNSEEAIGWFGELARAYLLGQNLPRPVSFVPIPNSSCAMGNDQVPRTRLLAQAIVNGFEESDVWDGLRWRTVMLPSSQGGTRNPQVLYDNLAIAQEVPARTLVLEIGRASCRERV